MKKLLTLTGLSALLALTACGDEGNNGGTADAGGNDTNETVDNANSNVTENGDAKVMKMHSADPPERPSPQALEEFKEIVESETGGSVEVEVYHSAQLGGDREALEGMQIGTVEGAVISTGPVAGFLPQMGVFDLPFLFPDNESAYDVLDGEIGEGLLEELGSQGMVGLSFWENGMRHLSHTGDEITSAEDIEGLDIRIMESQIHADIWNALGANPTPMAWPEVFAGLQQGVIDAQENPAGNIISNNLYEVQDYFTLTGHVYAANVFIVSDEFWKQLTEEEQEIVRQAALETRDLQRQLAAEEDEASLAQIEEEGMGITEISDEMYDQLFERVQSVYDEYESEFGAELIEEIINQTR